jgi:hypothetical protein
MAERAAKTAKGLRDAALKRVTRNSNGWVERAVVAMPKAIRTLKEPFIPEQIKLSLLKMKLVGHPRHYNAWGAAIRMAKKERIIRRVRGIGYCTLEASHGTEVPLYRRG